MLRCMSLEVGILPRCPQFGRYRGDSGHVGYDRRLLKSTATIRGSLSSQTVAIASAPIAVYHVKYSAEISLRNMLTDRKIIERFDAAREAERQALV